MPARKPLVPLEFHLPSCACAWCIEQPKPQPKRRPLTAKEKKNIERLREKAMPTTFQKTTLPWTPYPAVVNGKLVSDKED